MKNNDFRLNIKLLPGRSGIYIFKNSRDKPLYIGKTLNLKNRIKSYLHTEDIRLRRMVSEADKIDFIETRNDIESLILESQYIKKCRPPFNIMLRDDKQYGFVGFTDEKYPKIFITHQPTKIKNLKLKIPETKNQKLKTSYIGPFTDIGALKTALRLLRKIFPYCTCKQLHNNYCLNYHIEKCLGFCCLKRPTTNNLQLMTYKKNIKAIKDILSGKRESAIKQFEKEMQKLAEKQKFEKAIELQDKIEQLKKIFLNAKIIGSRNGGVMIYHNSEQTLEPLKKFLNLPDIPHRIEAFDIANIQGRYAVGAMVVFENGRPNKNEYRKFKIHTKQSPDDVGMLNEILIRRFNHLEWPYPNLIIVDGGKGQLNAISKIVRNTQSVIAVISVAKNKNHVGEKVFTTDRKNPIPLSKLPGEVKNLLLYIDSEAHRFAISYYRKIHRKSV